MKRLLFSFLLFFTAAGAFGSWAEKWNRGNDIPDTQPHPYLFSDSNIWINLWMGYSFCTLEDVRKSASDWNNYYFGSGSASAQADVDGFNLGLEGGWLFDGLNGLSLSVENIEVSQTSYAFSRAFTNVSQAIQPNVYSFSVNFYHFIDQKPDHQTYLCIGGGFYLSSVAFNETGTVGGSTFFNESGYWEGGVIGGTVGAGARINAGKNFGIQFDARGRYANFPMVTTNYYDSALNQSYVSALAVDPHGLIGQEAAASVGAGGNPDHFLDIDFSGFDLNVGIFYHF